MNDGFYKWAEFVSECKALMPVEANRLVQGDDGSYFNRLIKLAVLDLQKYVRAYTLNHETVYCPTDFVREGAAGRGVLPPNGRARDMWLFDVKYSVRYPVTEVSWEERFELVNGRVNVKDNNGRAAIDLQGYTFYIYPVVESGWLLSLWWDGLKTEFQDSEETPFDTLALAAAADYVRSELALPVYGDVGMRNAYLQTYQVKRRDCYLNAKERTRIQQ
jgi:hypothetical protein